MLYESFCRKWPSSVPCKVWRVCQLLPVRNALMTGTNAEAAYEQLVSHVRQTEGPQSIALVEILHNQARMHFEAVDVEPDPTEKRHLARLERAFPPLRRALVLQQHLRGASDPGDAPLRALLAAVALQQLQHQKQGTVSDVEGPAKLVRDALEKLTQWGLENHYLMVPWCVF